ncbi:MAG: HD domain-containing protein [Alphaproteobacteria bacterium]|uniref:HD domain-containing protein n=1 Tax=Candidatus Nitrobium versatile TaxID=2884831 RepID=A0A953M200_9BACT|nr:HD domain-containing protein [Candidatus Nitrobium versatile]
MGNAEVSRHLADEAVEIQKADNRPLYNSRIINTFVRLIKRDYPYITIGELLQYAGIEPYQVEDEGHWFTQEQVDRFYERLVHLTGNKGIAREAGRYAASPEAIGVMRQYVLSLVSPGNAYEIVGKYAHKFTRSSTYKSERKGTNRVEITVMPTEGIHEKPFQCENRIGYFEAIAKLFNDRLPEIRHPECVFKGGKVCRYIVSWKETRSSFLKQMRNYTALFLAAACFGLFFSYPETTLAWILPGSVLAILLFTIHIGHKETVELKAAIDSIRDSTDKLLERIDLNYNNALMLNEIGLALNKKLHIDVILENVVQVLEKRLDYDRGMILLADRDKKRLSFCAGFGYSSEQMTTLRDTSFRLDNPRSKGVFVVCFHEQKPFLVNNIDEIEDTLTSHSLAFARRMGAKSFICCPIVFEDESLGILAVDNRRTKRPLLQSDISLLMGIAPEIGISIRNALLIEDKEQQFRSMLQVLAASIDARDDLTAGHSEKVSEYAVGIANAMGLSRDYCEMIRVAALLHDYGKIGIKDSILKKRGTLTEEERAEIQTHAVKTRELLERVNFEGIYREIPEIAGNHHEKIDGSGYPKGLRGEEIPLGAKIIAVADIFESITSRRHYREPMTLDEAFVLLEKESGVRLDKKVIEAFMRYYRRQ